MRSTVMPPSGQKRRFGALQSTSGLPPGPDLTPIPRTVRHPVQGAQKDDRNARNCPRVGGVPDRRQSYVLQVRRAAGFRIIGLRRSNIAHHRRSWPASTHDSTLWREIPRDGYSITVDSRMGDRPHFEYDAGLLEEPGIDQRRSPKCRRPPT